MNNRRMFWAMVVGAVFRRRSRAVTAVIASMVGAATLFCLAAICIAVPQQMNEELRTYGANLIVTASGSAAGGNATAGAESSSDSGSDSGSASAGLDDATIRTLERKVTSAAEAKAATYRYESVRINAAPYVMAGVDVKAMRALNRHWNVDGAWPSSGRVLVGRDVADALGVQVGSTITIGYRGEENESAGDNSDNGNTDSAGNTSSDGASGQMRDGRVSTDILDTSGQRFQVSGVVDTGGSEDSIVYATEADMNSIAGKRGPDVIEFSSQADETQLASLVDSLNASGADQPGGWKARQVTKMTASNQRIITMLQTLFWIVSLVVLVLTLVGVSTTMASIVSQRRNEIGLRKALGASSWSVAAEFFVESALYGLVGGLIGMGLGYALARVLCRQVFERSLDFNVWLAVASVALSVVIAIIASIPPVRSATRIDPAIVLREE